MTKLSELSGFSEFKQKLDIERNWEYTLIIDDKYFEIPIETVQGKQT